MKGLYRAAFALALAVAGLAPAQSFSKAAPGSAEERLIGAWRLVHIDSAQVTGQTTEAPQPKGMLIYTRDGHMSVQLMYPKSANAPSNEYVQNGYEASFGTYDVDEAKHLLTHHVQGSITRDLLIGKDLPRIFEFTADGHLVIRSARPDEHWSVTWEHY